MAEILEHKSLGRMQGKPGQTVVQFLGIKYAKLKDRFASAEMISGNGGGDELMDATRLGPTVITAPEACEMDQSFVQQTIAHDPLVVSDLDGLNLNVIVPRSKSGSIDVEAKLPVFVYIHGGGFGIGSNSWPQLDLARFVEYSSRLGLPVIGVGINYRLGVPGFLTSSELREAGYEANNGLRDQQVALKWVRQHAEGFGGHPARVTVIGQSAGGVATTLHLYSREPLFEQAMCIGGTHLMMPPLPREVQERVYSSVLETLGLESLSSKERIDGLLKLPAEEMYSKFGLGLPLLPCVDGDVLSSVETFAGVAERDASAQERMPGKSWCKALLIGDSQFDGNVYHAMLPHLKPGAAQSFRKAVNGSLPSHSPEADALLQAYGLSAEIGDDAAFDAMARFGTDICFHAPTIQFASGWPGRAHVYHFNVPNPWAGPWKGISGHIFDVAILFMNYHERLPEEERRVAEKYAEHVVRFINGQEPFPAFGEEKGAMLYGPPGKGAEFIESKDPSKKGRSGNLVSVADGIGYDALIGVFQALASGG